MAGVNGESIGESVVSSIPRRRVPRFSTFCGPLLFRAGRENGLDKPFCVLGVKSGGGVVWITELVGGISEGYITSMLFLIICFIGGVVALITES
jgi:hypothetical protein